MSDTSEADATKPVTAAKEDEAAKALRKLVEQRLAQPPVRSQGTAVLGRGAKARKLAYDVVAGYVPVLSNALDHRLGEPQAAVFTIAYLARSTAAGKPATTRATAAKPPKGEAAAPRPVCFAFNGGPGSSSVWLHLGALGPKRVKIHDDGTMPPPPYAVVDNEHTWLEHFDLIFVDPPHTGWSVTASKEARDKMLSVDGDVDALAEVIRTWLVRHGRFDAPVYLAGESYGTTRGAALADKLLDHGVALSGVILVSCAMDLQTLVFAPGNDLPFALFLPGYACTAQYHGKLGGALSKSPQAAREAAEAFVVEDYLRALHRGASLQGNERTRIAKRVAELTGLSQSLVEQKNLRVKDEHFFVELLRAEGRVVGRLESRVTGPMAASRGHTLEFDPGIEAIYAPYAMAAQAYMAQTLGLESPQRYEIISIDAHKAWNWNRGEAKGNSFASTSPDLARAMRRNPHLRVFVASGHYDLGTPYSASNYSLSQLDAPPEVLARITHRLYDAGHMMYTREADLVKLAQDLRRWMEA